MEGAIFRRSLLTATLCLLSLGAGAVDETIQFHSTLDAAHEVPSTDSHGTGNLQATLDRATGTFNYAITYQGLTGPVTAAHFHGPADPGHNAPIVLPLTSPLNSPIKGTAKLSPEQTNQLLANQWYVNLHTAAHPAGEIRGQVLHGGP